MPKVMIDPGHGPGCVNSGSNGYREVTGMWKLSCYLKAALERCGVTAALTRAEGADPTVIDRGAKAKGYGIFISEHSNAANGVARGCECYYSVKRTGDKAYAAALSGASAALMGNADRGAKIRYNSANTADYYGVIRGAVEAGCPHVFLAETGFHDNVQDEAFLLQDDNIKLLAEAQANILCGILNIQYMGDGNMDEHWAEKAYQFLIEKGIAVNERRFDDIMTRGEVLTIVARALGYEG